MFKMLNDRGDVLSKELLKLADEIEELIKQGITEKPEGSLMASKFYLGKRLIEASFDKYSREHKSYRRCHVEDLPSFIRHLVSPEVAKCSELKGVSVEVNVNQSQNQSQTVKVAIEIVNQIIQNIDKSELSDTNKEEAKKLVEQVREEVTKPQANWEKVKDLLKKSFDYGLPVASGLMKLADLYNQFKGLA